MDEGNNNEWLKWFSGQVPSGPYFSLTLEHLEELLGRALDTQMIDVTRELVVIGLTSYFEAFCKDHFASILNIEPSLIGNLAKSGKTVLIDPRQAVALGDEFFSNVGFLVAEQHDFGSAQKINSLYCSLLKITPFSRDESKKYDQILMDRNLLVHHGGVYTSRYALERNGEGDEKKPFYSSVVITRAIAFEHIKFVETMAKKILSASERALTAYWESEGRIVTVSQKKAAESFLKWRWWSEPAADETKR